MPHLESKTDNDSKCQQVYKSFFLTSCKKYAKIFAGVKKML